MEGAIRAMNMSGASASAKQAAVMQKISYLQSKYYNFVILLQLPFLSLSTFWLYRKYRYNYAENLTLHTFITAQTTLMSMVVMLAWSLTGNNSMPMVRAFTLSVGLISSIYHIIMYMQFFKQKTVSGFFRALLAYVLGLVIFFISIMILSIIIGIILAIIFSNH
jgi:hypothetical protein